MVQRSHFKDALAVAELEIGHLNDIAEGFGNIDDAHQNQNQGHIQGIGQAAHRAAQKQRTGVAHKHLGGMEVIDQEAKQTAHQRRRQLGRTDMAPLPCNHRIEHHHGNGNGGGQAVYSVGKVHCIGRALKSLVASGG